MNERAKSYQAAPDVEDISSAQSTAPERWFRRIQSTTPSIRLFCFPYAGGSARMFREWPEWCEPEVEVVAVELPGRGFHSRTPAVEQMETMVERLLLALDPLLDTPFALFGHSMGALIAFELSRALKQNGRPDPLHLFVSGMRAPHLRGEYQIHSLPDRELIEALRALNGTSSEVIGDQSLLEIFLPLLRSDLRLAETYRYTPGPPVQHPITVFSGTEDITAPLERQQEWQRHTAGGCTVRVLEGDHFFIQQHAHLMAASILKSLGRTSLPAEFQPAAVWSGVEEKKEEAEATFTSVE